MGALYYCTACCEFLLQSVLFRLLPSRFSSITCGARPFYPMLTFESIVYMLTWLVQCSKLVSKRRTNAWVDTKLHIHPKSMDKHAIHVQDY